MVDVAQQRISRGAPERGADAPLHPPLYETVTTLGVNSPPIELDLTPQARSRV